MRGMQTLLPQHPQKPHARSCNAAVLSRQAVKAHPPVFLARASFLALNDAVAYQGYVLAVATADEAATLVCSPE